VVCCSGGGEQKSTPSRSALIEIFDMSRSEVCTNRRCSVEKGDTTRRGVGVDGFFALLFMIDGHAPSETPFR
jgi:hypothetical protein